LNIDTQIFEEFAQFLRPIKRWLYFSKILIKEYYKSVDLRLNQLNLFESSSRLVFSPTIEDKEKFKSHH